MAVSLTHSSLAEKPLETEEIFLMTPLCCYSQDTHYMAAENKISGELHSGITLKMHTRLQKRRMIASDQLSGVIPKCTLDCSRE